MLRGGSNNVSQRREIWEGGAGLRLLLLLLLPGSRMEGEPTGDPPAEAVSGRLAVMSLRAPSAGCLKKKSGGHSQWKREERERGDR